MNTFLLLALSLTYIEAQADLRSDFETLACNHLKIEAKALPNHHRWTTESSHSCAIQAWEDNSFEISFKFINNSRDDGPTNTTYAFYDRTEKAVVACDFTSNYLWICNFKTARFVETYHILHRKKKTILEVGDSYVDSDQNRFIESIKTSISSFNL